MAEDFLTRTPDISEAERRAVATTPDSSLQQAISSTQTTGISRDQGINLMGQGPNRLREAIEAQERISQYLTGRASRGISLTNQAIAGRQIQTEIDQRKSQEEEWLEWERSTQNLNASEAAKMVTSRQAANPLIRQNLQDRLSVRSLGLQDVTAGRDLIRAEDALEVESDPEVREAVKEGMMAKILGEVETKKAAFSGLKDSLELDSFQKTNMLVDAGLDNLMDTDPEAFDTLVERLSDPESKEGAETRAVMGQIAATMDAMAVAGTMGANDGAMMTFQQLANEAILATINPEVSNARVMIKLARHRKDAERAIQAESKRRELKKQALEERGKVLDNAKKELEVLLSGDEGGMSQNDVLLRLNQISSVMAQIEDDLPSKEEDIEKSQIKQRKAERLKELQVIFNSLVKEWEKGDKPTVRTKEAVDRIAEIQKDASLGGFVIPPDGEPDIADFVIK